MKKTDKNTSSPQSYPPRKWLPPLSEGKAILLMILILSIILIILDFTKTENSDPLRLLWILLCLFPLFYNWVNHPIKKKDNKVKAGETVISFDEIKKMGNFDIKLFLLYLQTTNNTIVIKEKFEKWKKKLSNKMLDQIKEK
jgi:hypothetical protein